MADVFISYSHENKDAARILAGVIEARGYDVWWDRELIAGDDYTNVIEEVLDAAKAVIVLWSAASRKSYWVRDEAAVGRDRNRLLPVAIDDNQPPLGFRQIHTISLKGWDGKSEGPLEDIWHGLAGLVGPLGGDIAPEPVAESANPFGAQSGGHGSAEGVRKIFAGVNAKPNQKSIAQIKKEEKKQRSFLKTFWVTSFIVSGALSVLMGGFSLFLEKDETIADMSHIELLLGFGVMALLLVGLGLIIGRFFIVIGRRLSKRKSVRYFDSVTLWCMGVSFALGILLAVGMMADDTNGDALAAGDSLYVIPMFSLGFIFPLIALITIPIGAIKGAGRKSFADGL